jgi:hypothetical protein
MVVPLIGGSPMTLLDEIRAIPAKSRETLESQYGIDTAEAFFAHAVRDPQGLRAALDASQAELDRLIKIVEGYLSDDYIDRCRRPAAKHPRGLIVDPD